MTLPPWVIETRVFSSLNHVPHVGFLSRSCPVSWLLISRLMSAPLFRKTFFLLKAASPYHFWMALHRGLYSIPNTHPAYVNPISGHHKAVVFMSNRQVCIIRKKPVVKCISSAWEMCLVLAWCCLSLSLFARIPALTHLWCRGNCADNQKWPVGSLAMS